VKHVCTNPILRLTRQIGEAEQAQQQHQLVDGNRVCAALAISRRTLDRWVACGLFAQPVKCGAGPKPRLRWRASDVAAFIERQAQQ